MLYYHHSSFYTWRLLINEAAWIHVNIDHCLMDLLWMLSLNDSQFQYSLKGVFWIAPQLISNWKDLGRMWASCLNKPSDQKEPGFCLSGLGSTLQHLRNSSLFLFVCDL